MSTKTVDARMAVTITLVFSDEAHREAWLEQQGVICTLHDLDTLDLKTTEGERTLARRSDYDTRKSNSDLVYTMGPIRRKVTP